MDVDTFHYSSGVGSIIPVVSGDLWNDNNNPCVRGVISWQVNLPQ